MFTGAGDHLVRHSGQLRYGQAMSGLRPWHMVPNTMRSLCSVALRCTLATSGSLSGSTVSSK